MFAVPELTVPRPATHRLLPPAALIRNIAADADSWRHLLRYDPDAPSRVPLPIDHPEVELWATGWLPGQSMAVAGAFTVVAGQIAESSARGSRVVRAGQTRVLGPGQTHRLVNVTEQPAITVHVTFRD